MCTVLVTTKWKHGRFYYW